ncbi:hypothetical protein GCM10010282_55940 [Streptomyces roseolus]|nr:hypothetical protein GCM10010282_55940 [Streptomyces roseolus]
MPRPLPAQEPDGRPAGGARVLPTAHPSAVLRARDRKERYEGLVADLRTAAGVLEDAAGQ